MKIFIFLLAGVLFVPGTLAQAPKAPQPAQPARGPFKVAILPVTIHSPESLEYLREGVYAMFSSRLELEGRISVMERAAVKKAVSQHSGEIDSEAAQKLGETLGADFVVFGSLTKLGDSASLDLKVLEVKGEKPASPVFVQAKKLEEIIGQVDVVARQVNEKILGYSPGPAVAEKTPETTRAPASVPPPVFAPPAPAAPPAQAGLPPVFGPAIPSAAGKVFTVGDFSQSQAFPFRIRGMAMGDVDGDGRNEIVFIESKSVSIYRWEANEFKLLKRFSGKNIDQFLAVDVGDMDKDGKAEIFVTNFPEDLYDPGHRMSSFVIAFRDGDFRIVASEIDWFFRIVEWEGKGPVLLGQQKGFEKSFEGPIYEMGWDGRTVRSVRKAEAPRGVFSLYGFTPFASGGTTLYAFIDSDFRLKVLDPKGKQVWRSSLYYGVDNAFKIKPIQTLGAYQGDEFASVNVRLKARGDEIIVIHNISPVADIFKREKVFTLGEIQILTWTGAMFVERWKSKLIQGYVVDFQVKDFDGIPGEEMVVGVNLPKEGILSPGGSSSLMVARIQ
ncbi:MAG: VCBS repeat-containing protein [Syntrophaceae bacterium]|nr:VCBS repeat-containing protein [Syntrophaceae bacterium]